MIDELVSHYRALEKLGCGGMGVVHKAQQSRDNQNGYHGAGPHS